jgi:glutamyl-tRNA reductase
MNRRHFLAGLLGASTLATAATERENIRLIKEAWLRWHRKQQIREVCRQLRAQLEEGSKELERCGERARESGEKIRAAFEALASDPARTAVASGSPPSVTGSGA